MFRIDFADALKLQTCLKEAENVEVLIEECYNLESCK